MSDPLRPDGLMLFDGVCHLCSGAVAAVIAFDRAGAIRFTPIQSPYGQALARAHGLDPDAPSTFVYFEAGQARAKAAGVAAVARRLGAPWSWIGALWAALPRGLADGLYDGVAARRYRLFGRRETCMVPGPAVRARFVMDDPGRR